MKRPSVLLASASPRRRELFGHLGYPFEAASVDVDESPLPGEAPQEMAERLALEKARAARPQNPHGITVGCDTIVVIDGEILGKPQDEAEAAAMLARLSGNSHMVLTAVAVLGPDENETVFTEATRVFFRKMTADEIRDYVATGEPMDKAGAYGIQEKGALFVERIEGDYFTVVGLPLCRLGVALGESIGPSRP